MRSRARPCGTWRKGRGARPGPLHGCPVPSIRLPIGEPPLEARGRPAGVGFTRSLPADRPRDGRRRRRRVDRRGLAATRRDTERPTRPRVGSPAEECRRDHRRDAEPGPDRPAAAGTTEGLQHLGSAEDVEGQIVCLRRQATLFGWLGRLGEARRASLEASALARHAGRTDLELDALAHVAMCSMFDSSHVDPAIELCRNLILEHEGDHRYRLRLTRPLATLIAVHGDPDEARSMLDDLTRLHEELGMDQIAQNAEARAFVEESAGDADALERVIRPLYDEKRRTRTHIRGRTQRCSLMR